MGSLFEAGVPVLLGLSAAATWGAADFCGGLATRRAAPSRVVLVAHGTSLLILLTLSFGSPAHLSGWAIVSGVLSGVAGGVALMLFYEALALGAMGLSAAIAGLLTAVLPVLLALRSQGAPALPQLAGFLVAAASIVLIAYAPAPAAADAAFDAGEVFASGKDQGVNLLPQSRASPSRKPLLYAVLAGLGFGLQLVWLHSSASAGSTAPGVASKMASRLNAHPLAPVLRALLLSRAGGTATALTALLWTHARRANRLLPKAATRPGGTSMTALAILAGLLDTSGNGLYMLSSLGGRLDVAAVLSSLYPGATIVLAAIFLRERATRLQALGMVCALVAVALIAA